MKTAFRNLALALLLLTSLSACSWMGMDDWFTASPPPPSEPVRDFSKFPYEQMAPEAPPAPKIEYPTMRPNPPDEYTWRPGFWSYRDGAGFVWNAGYWIQKPAFTAVWSRDFWVQRTYGWTLVPGHWE